MTFSVEQMLDSAVAFHQRGDLEQAKKIYNSVLQISRDQPDALHLLGVISAQTGNFAEAKRLITMAIAKNKNHPAYHANLAIALNALGNYREGLASSDVALKLKPGFVDALINKGISLENLNLLNDALIVYQSAIRSNPNSAEAYNNQGNVFKKLGKIPEAMSSYQQALKIRPGYADALNNRGAVHLDQGRLEDAITDFSAAISVNPNSPDPHSNLGTVYLKAARFEEALSETLTAISLRPSFASYYLNAGNILKLSGRPEEALAYFARAYELNKDFKDAGLNLGITYLSLGDLSRGFPLYENRVFKDTHKRAYDRYLGKPRWLGDDIKGKTLLLHAEQGFGDIIQFSRFVEAVEERGVRTIIETPSELLSIFERSFKSVSTCVQSIEGVGFDYFLPLMSLGSALRIDLQSIPVKERYLESCPIKIEYWKRKLGSPKGRRVGLVWSGNPTHQSDLSRSMTFETIWKSVSKSSAHVEFISLQREVRPSDREALERSGITHFGNELKDFDDTAALCELCERVISVDTSVVHLNAALGRPTWVLLPFVPDWRWLLEREDSPWYPTVRLFRQGPDRLWEPVLERVRQALEIDA